MGPMSGFETGFHQLAGKLCVVSAILLCLVWKMGIITPGQVVEHINRLKGELCLKYHLAHSRQALSKW